MNKVKKLKSLRPGERKILKALIHSPKSYSEIAEALKWTYMNKEGKTKIQNPTLLSKYLKRLQKLGLVSRDIDSRKYSAEKISIEKLFYNDVSNFLREEVAHDLEAKSLDEKTVTASASWFAVTDHAYKAFKNKLKELLEIPETVNALNHFFQEVNDMWESFVLSQRGKKEQKIIREYKKKLLEAYRLTCDMPSIKEHQDLLFVHAKEKLRNEFPELKIIPEETMYIETTRYLRRFEDAEKTMLQPRDLKDLETRFKIAEKIGLRKKAVSAEDKLRIEEIAYFLENKNHLKIYEGYLKSVDNEPKTLFVFPLLGFSGYLKKLKELYPEKATDFFGDCMAVLKKLIDSNSKHKNQH